MKQLIDFMISDEERAAFVASTNDTMLATRLRAEDAIVLNAGEELKRQRAGVWVVDAIAAHREAACGGAVTGNMIIAGSRFVFDETAC